jgi:hypothetical protein
VNGRFIGKLFISGDLFYKDMNGEVLAKRDRKQNPAGCPPKKVKPKEFPRHREARQPVKNLQGKPCRGIRAVSSSALLSVFLRKA